MEQLNVYSPLYSVGRECLFVNETIACIFTSVLCRTRALCLLIEQLHVYSPLYSVGRVLCLLMEQLHVYSPLYSVGRECCVC